MKNSKLILGIIINLFLVSGIISSPDKDEEQRLNKNLKELTDKTNQIDQDIRSLNNQLKRTGKWDIKKRSEIKAKLDDKKCWQKVLGNLHSETLKKLAAEKKLPKVQ